MRKLVVIGANNFQRPLIRKARQMGLETHVFAWEKGAVGREFADHFYPISILEKERILDVAKAIHPDGIASIGSDLAIATVNHVAGRLGLTANSPECIRVTTDKFAMREQLSQCGLPVPRYTRSAKADEIHDACGEFPLIVKPTDRSGSRGVTLAHNAEELERAIERAREHSFQHRHIVEQFVPGREFSVEMISWRGKHHSLQVTDKETSGDPYYVEMAHHQPAELSPALREKIVSLVKEALTCLGVEFGASHSELLLAKDQKLCIVEIGARMGGDYIGSHLVELSTGYDYVRGVIDVAMGEFHGVTDSRDMFSGIRYVFARPGTLNRIEDNSGRHPEILFSEVYYKIGGTIREVRESNDRAACYVYQSDAEKFSHSDGILILE